MANQYAIQDQNHVPASILHTGTADTAETVRQTAQTTGEANYYAINARDFALDVQRGSVAGVSTIHKFGANDNVGTGLTIISYGGIYQTPTTATPLEVISSSTNDSGTGTGARQLTVIGLNSSWNEITQTVDLNGTAPVNIGTALLRLYRMYVSQSGAYASLTTPSQTGSITVRGTGAGDTWGIIPTLFTGFGVGQSLIGAYTVPAGYTAYILGADITVDSLKTADAYFFKRENANDGTVPYTGILRMQNKYVGMAGLVSFDHSTYESYPEKTDIGFMAQASAAADVSTEFELLLVQN